MNHVKLDPDKTHAFSATFLSYIGGNDALKEHYHLSPEPGNIPPQIDAKKEFPQQYRDALVRTLNRQYEGYEIPDRVSRNIASLGQSATYTITTGHQLNLFTGPLYVIYKLVTIIRTCQELNRQFPGNHFVPVYWMATEDHDFAEIDHFFFNGHRYQWETSQNGAVGRFRLEEMQPLLKKLAAFPDFFLRAYGKNKNLSDAVREYMNALFGEYGLVVLDPDTPELKKQLTVVMEDDILHSRIAPLVNQASDALTAAGFKPQVNVREVNFFYLTEEYRARIDPEEDHFRLQDQEEIFSRQQMEQLIHETPERLSPNVILRPLYQEMVLPNLAYCGGPSELVYWLQLKPVFDHYHIPFPLLLPRNFALIITKDIARKWEKTGFDWPDLFRDRDELIRELTLRETTRDLHLNGEISSIGRHFSDIRAQAVSIDPTLEAHVEAQWARTKKRLEGIEKKFIRAEKKKHTDKIRQVHEVLDALFPEGTLQERHDNFLNFYQTDAGFIHNLMEHFDPFDCRFNLLIDDE